MGAGIGPLPGMVAAEMGAESIVITDRLPAIVCTIEENIGINFAGSTSSHPIARLHDWAWDLGQPGTGGEEEPRQLEGCEVLAEGEAFDLIIGAELVWQCSHCRPLSACVARRLRPAVGSVAWIVCAVRDESLIALLVSELEHQGLHVTRHQVI